MCDCGENLTVLEGPAGLNGKRILYTYNDTTGLGNNTAVGEDIIFQWPLAANTLITDGDELELFINLNYFDNDLVNLNIKLDNSNVYTLSISNAVPDIRFISIIIARVSQTEQFWTIQQLVNGSSKFIQTIDTASTGFDLSTASNFQITLDNTVMGAGQVMIKKAVLYQNIVQ